MRNSTSVNAMLLLSCLLTTVAQEKGDARLENSERVDALALLPDGKSFLAAGRTTLTVWNAETSAIVNTRKLHDGFRMRELLLNNRGELQAVVTEGDKGVYLTRWNPKTAKLTETLRLATGKQRTLTPVATNGRWVVWNRPKTGGNERLQQRSRLARRSGVQYSMVVHDLQSKTDVLTRDVDGPGHVAASEHWLLGYHPVVAAGIDDVYAITIFDAKTGTTSTINVGARTNVVDLSISADQKHLIVRGREQFAVYRLAKLEFVYVCDMDTMAISPDGTMIAVAHQQRLRLLRTDNGDLLREIQLDSDDRPGSSSRRYSTRRVSFSSDGRHIAATDSSGKLRIAESDSGFLLDSKQIAGNATPRLIGSHRVAYATGKSIHIKSLRRWREFKSEKFGFRALFPGQGKWITTKRDTEPGKGTRHVYCIENVAENDVDNILVDVLENPPETHKYSIEQRMKNCINSAGLKVVSEERITVNQVPGHRMHGRQVLESGGRIEDHYISLYRKERTYGAIVIEGHTNPHKPRVYSQQDIERFLNSFEFLDGPDEDLQQRRKERQAIAEKKLARQRSEFESTKQRRKSGGPLIVMTGPPTLKGFLQPGKMYPGSVYTNHAPYSRRSFRVELRIAEVRDDRMTGVVYVHTARLPGTPAGMHCPVNAALDIRGQFNRSKNELTWEVTNVRQKITSKTQQVVQRKGNVGSKYSGKGTWSVEKGFSFRGTLTTDRNFHFVFSSPVEQKDSLETDEQEPVPDRAVLRRSRQQIER